MGDFLYVVSYYRKKRLVIPFVRSGVQTAHPEEITELVSHLRTEKKMK